MSDKNFPSRVKNPYNKNCMCRPELQQSNMQSRENLVNRLNNKTFPKISLQVLKIPITDAAVQQLSMQNREKLCQSSQKQIITETRIVNNYWKENTLLKCMKAGSDAFQKSNRVLTVVISCQVHQFII